MDTKNRISQGLYGTLKTLEMDRAALKTLKNQLLLLENLEGLEIWDLTMKLSFLGFAKFISVYAATPGWPLTPESLGNPENTLKLARPLKIP